MICIINTHWYVDDKAGDNLTGALHVLSPVVTTTSIIPSSNKIQNGDILVPANPGPPGKWPLKRREKLLSLVSFLRDRSRHG